MLAVQYPFIDVAVHRDIRDRFARGDALVLFSRDLGRVLWANGKGAAFFGASSIYDFIDQGPDRREIAFRQVESTARQIGALGEGRSLLVRVSTGFQMAIRQAELTMIQVRGTDPVMLLCVPDPASASDRPQQMLKGFDDPDTHIAVLDDEGHVLAGSEHFDALGITGQTTLLLIQAVSNAGDRLVKRPIPTGRGYLPAAIGKLSDAPGLYLLFAVETILGDMNPNASAESEQMTGAPAADPKPAPQDYDDVVEAIGDIEDIDEEPSETEEGEPAQDAGTTRDVRVETEVQPVNPEPYPAPIASEPATENTQEGLAIANVQAHDAFHFQQSERPVRFVWKIDATGRFSEVSEEFAQAVGPRASDINGQAFSDLAALFNLDPDGKITELLKRRDTWSGKTIHWPVEGTSLMVPVDLAALPTYTRNRDFDGFRGFGIVRIADAMEDPHATGMSFLSGMSSESADPADAEEPYEAPSEDDVSFYPEDESADADTATTDAAPLVGQPDTPDTRDYRLAPEMEPPALRLVSTDGRRHSDKVIRLEERRTRGKDGLTTGEQAAFREIARQLDPLGLREGLTKPAEAEEHILPEAPAAGEPDSSDQVDVAVPMDPAAPETTASQGEADASHATEIPAPVCEEAEEPAAAPPVVDTTIDARGLSAATVNMMPMPLLVHRGDTLIHANADFLELTGYDDLAALVTAGGLDALLERQSMEEGAEHGGQIVVVRADDDLIPVTAKLQSVRWEGSSALLLALTPISQPSMRPVAAPQADNVELQRLKVETEELRSILETATDGVVILGSDGEIRSMNRSASALFNYDEAEMRGKPFVMLFAHESQKAILDYLNGLNDNGVASVLNDGREVIGREASGGFLPLFMTIGRLTSSGGYCAVIRDITQWKRTEEDLRNAKRAAETANAHKTDFLARVSHEIRTPLNAIIGFADMMASEHFGPIGHSRYAEYAGDIGRSGRHVLDIVNDLLDISKIEAGEMEMDFVAVGLNDTVASAVSIVQPQANGQRVIIRTALSQSVPHVVADPRSVKQIVLNILANAIRFTPSGGQIIVSTAYEPNGSVVLRIRDTGIGMTRAELEQAMRPFRQVAAGPRNRGDGTGLGLPLTKAMVDANRATFSIHSTPNEGTLVEIVFPSPRVLAG